MVGARDLDGYGTWESLPVYGAVWYPSTVPVGWAPYRYGNWTWVAPFGWTWVDAAPWGYAPFHFGRWMWASGRWGWCPGDRGGRPRWAPALVAWYGSPGGDGSGTVYGWVPLGWGEPYIPTWRRCSGNCWRQYNQPYAVAQADPRPANLVRFANAGVPGAMTAVNAAVLRGSRPIAPNQVSTDGWVTRAPVLAGAPERGPLVRNAAPSTAAAPIPAGAQHQQLSRSTRPAATPIVAEPGVGSAVTPPAVAAGATAANAAVRRRTTVPVASTPGSAGTPVATPVAASQEASVGASSSTAVYTSVHGARGAYTGAPPTPGPKAPVVVDRGIAVPPNVPTGLVRPAPVAVVPQAGLAPQAGFHGVPREAPASPPAGLVRSAPTAATAAAGPALAPASIGGASPK
jgi:hypothetical protein